MSGIRTAEAPPIAPGSPPPARGAWTAEGRRFGAFGALGALNTVLTTLLYQALLLLGVAYGTAYVLAYGAGVLFASSLQPHLVFGSRYRPWQVACQSLGYVLVGAVGTLLLHLIVKGGASAAYAVFFVPMLLLPVNYLVVRRIASSGRSPRSLIEACDPRRWSGVTSQRALLLAAGFLAASPAFWSSYAMTDDYNWLWQTEVDHRVLLTAAVGQGRLLGGLAVQGPYAAAEAIADLRWMRLASAVLLALTLLVLHRAGSRWGLPPSALTVIGLLIICLPSTRITIGWAVLAIGSAATLLSAFAAARAIGTGGSAWSSRDVALAAVALLAALSFYQPGAMFFWVVALVWGLSPAAVQASPRVRLLVLARLAVAAGAALAAEAVAVAVGTRLVQTESDRGALAADLGGKLEWFWQEALPRAATPFSLQVNTWEVAAVAAAVLMALPARRSGETLWRLMVVVGGVAASYLPNLVTAENWASHRTMIALSPALVVAATLGASRLGALLAGVAGTGRTGRTGATAALLAATCLAAAFSGERLANTVVNPQVEELRRVRAVEPQLTANGAAAVLPSSGDDALVLFIDYDEAGVPSTFPSWSASALLEQVHLERTGRRTSIPVVTPDQLSGLPAGTRVLHAGELLNPTGAPVITVAGPRTFGPSTDN